MDPICPRHSNGLEQFFTQLGDRPGLRILDLAGASQANVSFITGLGHRLYAEDVLRSLDEVFGAGDFFADQSRPFLQDTFLRHSLDFPEDFFDGILTWDALEYMAAPLLRCFVDRLARILKPDCHLLAFFHADERAESVPLYSYRIAGSGALLLTPRGMRRPAQLFNNRSLEKLFEQYQSVKFFLARDQLREVIVRR